MKTKETQTKETQNAVETTSYKATPKRLKIIQRFGSKTSFIVWLVCTCIMALSLVAYIMFIIYLATGQEIKDFDRGELLSGSLFDILQIVVSLALINIPLFMQERLGFRIPVMFHVIVSIFVLCAVWLGEVVGLYDFIKWWDDALHALSGVVISLLGFTFVYGISNIKNNYIKLSPMFILIVSFCFTLALLTLWEIFEFAMDSFFGTNMQRWQDGLTDNNTNINLSGGWQQGSGLIDTMVDVLVGVGGALLTVIICGIVASHKTNFIKYFVLQRNTNKTEEQPQDSNLIINDIKNAMSQIDKYLQKLDFTLYKNLLEQKQKRSRQKYPSIQSDQSDRDSQSLETTTATTLDTQSTDPNPHD